VRTPPAWVWLWVSSDGIWDGEVWRLVTTAFFHGGTFHFLFNAWWCWDLGRGVEDGWGHGTTFALYVVGAGFASAVEWMAAGGGVGLSGVVYAMAGFLWAQRDRHPTAAALMSPQRAQILMLWFLACVVLTLLGVWRVGNWAHGAGAAWGWMLGAAYGHRRRRPLVAAVLALGVAAIALAPFVAFGPQAERRAEHVAVREAARP
jgi:GlpG protein